MKQGKINLSNYTKQTFGMYDGKVESVTMRFPNNRVGTVPDRFGREVMLMKADDSKPTARIIYHAVGFVIYFLFAAVLLLLRRFHFRA